MENDDRTFGLGQVLELHRRIGVRIVWDVLHHHCHPVELAERGELIDQTEDDRIAIDLAGVVVVDVDNGSYASNLGFQRGDVIQEVNGERITRTHDLERLSKTQNRAWRIVIVRNGQKISAVFGG